MNLTKEIRRAFDRRHVPCACPACVEDRRLDASREDRRERLGDVVLDAVELLLAGLGDGDDIVKPGKALPVAPPAERRKAVSTKPGPAARTPKPVRKARRR